MTAQLVVICTVIAHNYLAFARVMIQSIKQQHPDMLCAVLIVDHEIYPHISLEDEPFVLVTPPQLNIPHWQHFSMKYDVLELCTDLKPFLMAYLFEHYQAEKVIYLDADIRVYSSLQPLLDILDTHTAVLTPHILTPYNDSAWPTDLMYLRVGTFNLGFFALARRGDWQRLLAWWQEKLYTQGLFAVEQGMFVDQHWADLFPSLFEGVHILRHSQYNVAYWNVGTRDITQQGKQYHIDGKPLVFFHFSGIILDNLEVLSLHQNRHRLSALNPLYQQIFYDYAEAVKQQGHAEASALKYGFGQFADGVPIAYPLRVCLRGHDPQAVWWPQPFDIDSDVSFRKWALEPQANGLSYYAEALYAEHKATIPRLAPALYRDWLLSQENQAPIYHPFYLAPIKATSSISQARLWERTLRYYLDFPTVVAPTLPPDVMDAPPKVYSGPRNLYGRVRQLLHQLHLVQGMRRLVGLRLIMTVRFFFIALERERTHDA